MPAACSSAGPMAEVFDVEFMAETSAVTTATQRATRRHDSTESSSTAVKVTRKFEIRVITTTL